MIRAQYYPDIIGNKKVTNVDTHIVKIYYNYYRYKYCKRRNLPLTPVNIYTAFRTDASHLGMGFWSLLAFYVCNYEVIYNNSKVHFLIKNKFYYYD